MNVFSWVNDYDDITNDKTFNGSLNLNWNINKYFSYSLRAGGNIVVNDRKRWYGIQLPPGENVKGLLAISNVNKSNYTVENLLNFNMDLTKDFRLSATAGITYDEYHFLTENVSGNTFSIYDLRTKGLSNAGKVDVKQPIQKDYQLLSYLGRVNLSAYDKYLLTASLRADGSSKFKKGNRWAYFPSFSLAWRMEQEAYMKSIDWLSQLKVRVGYGETGNQGIDPYKFVPTMSQVEKKDVAWLVNGAKPLTLNAPGLVSDSFTWETVETLDFGFDITALNGRLQSTFDWYRRDTKDMLAPGAELPSVVGASAPLQNTADLRTKGWELSLTWRDRIGAWGYNVGFNLYDSKTVVTKYHNESKIILKSDGTNNYYEGYEIGSIWGYVTDGYYTADDFEDTNTWKLKEGVVTVDGVSPRPGDIKYQNLRDDGSSTNRIDTGDGTFDNPGDRKIIGNNSLRLQYGINLGVNYKGFDLSVLLQGVGTVSYTHLTLPTICSV